MEAAILGFREIIIITRLPDSGQECPADARVQVGFSRPVVLERSAGQQLTVKIVYAMCSKRCFKNIRAPISPIPRTTHWGTRQKRTISGAVSKSVSGHEAVGLESRSLGKRCPNPHVNICLCDLLP